MIMRPKFSLEDANRAYDAWGANCGPTALAAIMGMTLDEVRPHLKDFEAKHYTNPSMMFGALWSIGRGWRKLNPVTWPWYGLARIQWEGPWTEPGVPMRVRYRETHWIGVAIDNRVVPASETSIGIFDVNAMGNGSGWTTLQAWKDILVPHIIKECVPRANGKWHITHAIEVERMKVEKAA